MVVVISDNTFSIDAKHIPKNKNVNKYRLNRSLIFQHLCFIHITTIAV